jgi:hypothetical protein
MWCRVEGIHTKFSRKFVHSLKRHCGEKAHTLTWRHMKYGNAVKSSSQSSELHNFWTRPFICPLCSFTMTATALAETSTIRAGLPQVRGYLYEFPTSCCNDTHFDTTYISLSSRSWHFILGWVKISLNGKCLRNWLGNRMTVITLHKHFGNRTRRLNATNTLHTAVTSRLHPIFVCYFPEIYHNGTTPSASRSSKPKSPGHFF